MKKVVPFTKTITFKTMIAEITDIEVSHTLELKENREIEGDILVDGTYKMTDASQIEEEFHYQLPFMIEIDPKYNLDHLEITIGDFYFEIINEEDLKINVEIDMDGIEETQEEIVKAVTKVSLEDEMEILDEMGSNEEIFARNDEEDEMTEMPIPIEVDETTQKVELQSNFMNPLDKLATEIEEDIKNDVNTPNFTETQSQVNYQNGYTQKQEVTTSSNVGSIFSSLASNEETFSTYYVYIVRESDTVEAIMDKYKTTKEELQNYNDLSDVKVGSKLIIPCTSNE